MGQSDGYRSLSDEELVAQAKLSGFRLFLHDQSGRLGCLAALLLLAGVIVVDWYVVAMNPFGWAFLLLVVGLGGQLGAMAGLERLAVLGKVGPIRELRRRNGLLPLEAYIEEERAVPGLSFSLLARMDTQPHLRQYFIRVRFCADGTAHAEMAMTRRSDVDWVHGVPVRDVVMRWRETLEGEARQRIESRLFRLEDGWRNTFDADAIGGAPARMIVLRHDSGQILCCAGNPGAEAGRGDPAMELLRAVVGLGTVRHGSDGAA